MKLSLSSVVPDAWGDPNSRYDENSGEKFDFEERTRPTSKLFQQFDDLLDYCPSNVPLPPSVTIRLAEIALRTRNLVGVVLGSTVNTLWHIREKRRRLHKHKDLDVLILNPHSSIHPYPREWAVDWWVRPEGKPPTNGDTSLWYDLELQPFYTIEAPDKYPASPIDIAVKVKPPEMKPRLSKERCTPLRKISADLREGISTTLAPGLYLPDFQTMKAIQQHAITKEETAMQLWHQLVDIFENENFFLTYYNLTDRTLKTSEIDHTLDQLEEICRIFKIHLDFPETRKSIETFKTSPLHIRDNESYKLHKLFENIFKHMGHSMEERENHGYQHLSIAPVSNEDRATPLTVLPARALVFKPL